MAANTFAARVKEFWNWFEASEATLEDRITRLRELDAEEVTGFLSKGLDRTLDGVVFEMGGDHEINLSPEGSPARCFLTSYIAAAMPFRLREKWTVTPWKIPAPEGFAVRMFGISVSPEDVMVDVHHEQGSNSFALVFCNESLSALDEDDCYHFFYILLEAALGENICLSHIRGIHKARAEEDGMVPLSDLGAVIRDTLAADGREVLENPCFSLVAYSMEPEESDTPRHDVITGYTSLPDLLDDYYGEESPVCDMLEENGAGAGFVMYRHGEREPGDALELRNAIAERLEEAVLGEAGSGDEVGFLLGQACGRDCCYIDLLLYDEQAFFDAAPAVLAEFGYEMIFFSFCPGEGGVTLVQGEESRRD